MNPVFDVVVVGGGPSGSCAALQLARRGCRVAIVERTRYESRRVGETIDPAISTVLEPLGLWRRFRDANASACVGIRSRWGRDAPLDRSFMFNAHGHAWHVDRRCLDRMLFEAAADAGVDAMQGMKVHAVERHGDEWRLEVGTPARSMTRILRTRFAVDASGRAAALGRKLGARRIAGVPLLATTAWFRLPHGAQPLPPMTQVDACEEGWYYLAPQPGSEAVLAFLGAAPAHGAVRPGSRALARARLRTEFLEGATQLGIQACRAESSRLDPVGGSRWLAVGDAGLCVDPLSGDGVLRSMLMTAAAANAIVEDLNGAAGSIARYCDGVLSCEESYRASEAEFYGRERRWRARPFWSQRARSAHPAG